MSMYNLAHGENSISGVLMKLLNIEYGATGRYRDCYLTKNEGNEYRIHIYTRNGGGNRESYQDVFDQLSNHPYYVEDFDDDFDCTYATISFKFPEEHKELLPELVTFLQTKKPSEKWEELIAKLSKQ